MKDPSLTQVIFVHLKDNLNYKITILIEMNENLFI